jgi:hypothetical protein
MNYLAHALQFLDRPYFAAGTAVPDWLAVADRRVRLRIKHAQPYISDPDPVTAAVAGGTLEHLRADARFHKTRAFAELTWRLTAMLREALGEATGLRSCFLGHILVEILLDAALATDKPHTLELYYRSLEDIEPALVEAAVNRMAPRPTKQLATMIEHFRRQTVLWDYLEDDKLLARLNQIMRRVKLPPLPEDFMSLFAPARALVSARLNELLAFNTWDY